MQGHSPSLFDGLAADQIARVMDRLDQRRFPAGATVIAEGDLPRALYIFLSGAADIIVTDRRGSEHCVGHVGAGATVGEMSLLTGHPASATVRAVSDLHVLVMSEAEFLDAAVTYPFIYRNLGVILAERLARTNRRAARYARGRVAVLLDDGAPALLGYALACSVAWHTRAPVLLVVVAGGDPPPELAELAASVPSPRVPFGSGAARALGDGPVGADLLLTAPTGAFAPRLLTSTLEELASSYDHVLVQLPAAWPAPVADVRTVRLTGPALQCAGDERPGHTIIAWATDDGARPDRSGILRVPRLGPADQGALTAGRLPAATPAGRALGWAARDVAELKVGLVLGAGGVKGYAHIGVLRVLERAGVSADYVAGTSIGSPLAAGYAVGYSADAMAQLMDELGMAAFRLTIPISSLLSSAAIRMRLRRLGPQTRFEDLPLPLAVVAADVVTRREIVFRRGLVWPVLMASMAIPGIYPAQRLGPYVLVDGGVLNPVPSKVAAEMGADQVIAVRLATSPSPPGKETDPAPAGRAPSIVQVLTRSIEMMQSKISTDTAAAATIVIAPELNEVGGVGLRNFIEGRRYIELGEAAAEAALPRITAALPWLRG
jgi:predicted acylesterase/phospholipase RssA